VIVDFDDFHETNHRLDLLERLHDANPRFRCTLFAVPGMGRDLFWESVPEWCELAVHGWMHPDPYEAENWTHDQAMTYLCNAPVEFVDGFKAPGWQISDGTYQALMELGWWCADHYENDGRRPAGLRCHVISPAASIGADPDHWHGHIQDVCGNGMVETWDALLQAVTQAKSFEFISEVVGNPVAA
jgi:hypothetical protein